MATNPDVPPTHTVKPVDPPPPSDQPTSAMLKADIDSGRTGEKVAVFDPGLASLGTDDEAAGQPPSPVQIVLARYQEIVGRWMKGGRSTSAAHPGWDITLTGFIGLVAALGVVLLIGIWVGAR